ncbi:MAG: hypothetical protein ACOVMT_05885 [Caulobacter sp.]
MADVSARLERFDRWRGLALIGAWLFAILLTGSFAGRDLALAPPLPFLLLLGVFGSLLTYLLASIPRHGRRVLWFLLILLPGLLISFLVVIFLAPVSDEIASTRLPDGRTAHLSTDATVVTDVSYSLWVSSPGAPFWRRHSRGYLSYSEDGSYIGDERLHVSANGKRLLVGRGGVWTDCFEINQDFTPCDLGVEQPWWSDTDYPAKMRAYSDTVYKAGR